MSEITLCLFTNSLVDISRVGDVGEDGLGDDLLTANIGSFLSVASRLGKISQALLSSTANLVVTGNACSGRLSDMVSIVRRVGNSLKQMRRDNIATVRHCEGYREFRVGVL